MTPPDSSLTPPKPQNFVNVLSRMVGLLWRPQMARWRWRMALALVLTLVAKLFAVGAPVLLGEGINRVAAGDSPPPTSDLAPGIVSGAAAPFIWAFVLFALARFASNGLPQLRDAFFVRVTQEANRMVAVEAFAHAQAQSLQFHVTRRAGAVNRVIERGAGAMEYLLRFLGFNIGPTLIELLLAAGVMAALYSWSLGLAAVLTVAAYTLVTIIVTEWRNKLRREMNEVDTELRAITMDTMANFETVKAFGAERRETGRFNAAMGAYSDRFVRVMQSLNLLNGAQEFIMTAGLFSVAVIAAFLVRDGQLQAGDLTAVVLMLTNIYRPLNILGFAWREIKQGAVDIEKLFELMDRTPEIRDAPDAISLTAPKGDIRFDDVHFTHEGREQGLGGVTFDIPAGAFVGLAGPSGAGKSTILKLLFRFYDPAAGRILIDGADLKQVTQQSLRETLGLVPQEVVLFNDSLRFNLAYARPDASDQAIRAAAERAQLGPFIDSLPEGLDTRVGERGLKLSGGEKQRVGVARAILLDPAILVLDEATSSLDSETEKDVQQALAEAAKGRTTIAVAHRLSTIAGADFILVLDKGRVAEIGRHDDLVKAGGLYATLWRRQTEEGLAVGWAPTPIAPHHSTE